MPCLPRIVFAYCMTSVTVILPDPGATILLASTAMAFTDGGGVKR